jgi:spore maturation protein CgeB
MQGRMPREMVGQFLTTLTEFKPDFVFSVNLSGMDQDGLFAQLFADLRIPFVTWFVDDPRTILMERTVYGSDYAVALTWERSYAGYLRNCAFGEVHVVPMAADLSVFDAEPADVWPLPPTFIGNSMEEFADREWAWVHERPMLAIAVMDAFEAGRVTREHFGRGLDAMMDPVLLSAFDADERRHAEMVFFIEGTRRLREALARRLGPDGLVVRGDPAWSKHTAQCGPWVNYTQELPGYYRDCEVNVNVTSIQMASAVNQRVFDCPAAGGFLLTDAQASLGELFEVGEEMAVFESLDECAEKVRYYRAHPGERVAMIRRARRRVLGEHTYPHRLRHIAGVLKARFG